MLTKQLDFDAINVIDCNQTDLTNNIFKRKKDLYSKGVLNHKNFEKLKDCILLLQQRQERRSEVQILKHLISLLPDINFFKKRNFDKKDYV